MKFPTPIKKEFTFDPAFHLHTLRYVEQHLENLLKRHPSPNQANTKEGESADDIAENYSAFLSLKNMISEAAHACDMELQQSRLFRKRELD